MPPHARPRALTAAALAAVLMGLLAPAAQAAPTPNPSPSSPVGGPRMAEAGVVIADLSRGAPAPPDNDAVSWVIADVTTGEVLAAKNPHERLKPASTLKTLTLLSVLPELEADEQYTAVYDDAAQDGSKVGLVPDAGYTAQDLFYGMMLPSGNDAAHALANMVGGSAEAAAVLNAEANRIGAFDTVAVNTSGLDVEGQVSSAYDMALIQANGLKNTTWREIYGAEVYDFPAGPVPDGTARPTFKTYTKNKLVLNDYPGIIGGKTGYTDASQRTYVAAAERDGHLIVVTFMRYLGDTEAMATQAFEWAFANRAAIEAVGDLVTPDDVVAEPSPTAAQPEASAAQAANPANPDDPATVPQPADDATTAVAGVDSTPDWLILAGSGVLLALAMVIVGSVVRGQGRRNRATRDKVGLQKR